MVVGPVAARAAGPRGVLEEGLVVEARRLVVGDVARLPRRGQRQLRLWLRLEHAHILPLVTLGDQGM